MSIPCFTEGQIVEITADIYFRNKNDIYIERTMHEAGTVCLVTEADNYGAALCSPLENRDLECWLTRMNIRLLPALTLLAMEAS